MAKETVSNDGWSPCPKGTLTGLSRTLKSRERVQRFKRISSLVAVLLITATAGTWFVNRSSDVPMENSYGGITCTEVRDSLPQMVSGKADERLVAKINAHLAECPRCAEMARKMKEREMHAAARQSVDVSDDQQHAVLLAGDAR